MGVDAGGGWRLGKGAHGHRDEFDHGIVRRHILAGLVYINRFPELAAALKPALQKGVQATGEQMVSNIEGPAPRESGFMAENGYVSGPLSSTYGSGSIRPSADSYPLPQLKPSDAITAIVDP